MRTSKIIIITSLALIAFKAFANPEVMQSNNLNNVNDTNASALYDKILPDNPNADIAELDRIKNMGQKNKYTQQKMLSLSGSNRSNSETYTYLRCYYRINNNPNDVRTDYIWGLNNDGSYYRVNGYWHDGSMLSVNLNLFYTNTSQNELNNICYNTLSLNNKSTDNFMAYVADNRFSYNHETWNNNLDQIDNRKINRIISFGDSLSDSHNMFNASQWKLPSSSTHMLGRFTNGLTWVEYISQQFNMPLNNWAVGGAGGDTVKLILPGLRQQIDSWVTYKSTTQNYNPQHTLVTIWIGGNDLISYDRTVSQIIGDVNYTINILIKHGIKNILVMNLPNLTQTPLFVKKYNTTKNVEVLFNDVVEYNQQLEKLVNTIKTQYADMNIVMMDTFSIMDNILKYPAQYGFTNYNQSCLEINDDSAMNYINPSINPRAECNNANDFVFWDILHPTTKSHKIIANEVANTLIDKFNLQ